MHSHHRSPARRRVFAVAVGLVLLIGSGTGAAELGAQQIESDQTVSTHEPADDHHASDDETTHDGSAHDGGSSHDGSTHDDSQHDSQGGHSDNLECADVDPRWSQVTLKGHPLSGHYQVADADRSVEIFVYDAPAGGKLVNWSSDAPISAVMLRSGQDVATYEYEPPATNGSGLLPPLVDREGRNLAAVLACYQADTVDVGIDIYLSDSTDPVEVGMQFSYVIDVSASGYLVGSSVLLDLAQEVVAVDGGGCTITEQQVECAPPLNETTGWTTTITVEAVGAGTAVTWVHLEAQAAEAPVSASALEVTRIIGPRGHGGGCGSHEEGGDDHTSGGDHEDGDCGSDQHGLAAACTAIDPAAQTVVLEGPFASRRYQLDGPGQVEIQIEIGERTGAQMATWQANVPVEAVLARTGQEVEIYRNQPPSFEGSGVVGPMSGSGPRPMADIAFCVVDRSAVDLRLSIDSAPVIPLGRVGWVSATITNDGYREAFDVTLGIGASDKVALRSCGEHDAAEGTCELDSIAGGDQMVVNLGLEGITAGSETLTVVVSAENEEADDLDNNTVTRAITVEAHAPQSPAEEPTVPYDSVVPPFDEPAAEPPPVVLSSELGAGIEETEVAPPAAVTPEMTALPFTGTTTLGVMVGAGMAMLSVGGLLIAGVALLDHRSQGAHSGRMKRRKAT